MSLTIAIVGRANVGKSTLFNRIVGEQRALVHDLPGVTRDRLYATANWRVKDRLLQFTIVDTGGLELGKEETLQSYVRRQTQVAIEEADLIIAMVDGRAGLLPDDEELIRVLRKANKKIFICVNKVDANLLEDFILPFHKLGLNPVFPISAQHNRGIDALMDHVLAEYQEIGEFDTFAPNAANTPVENENLIRLAIVGRPNVGKSRLLNYLCGEERSVVSPLPGTTIDPIDTYITHEEQRYLLIDTAGIRRQAKINETLEYLSVLRSLRAVGRAQTAILVIDANEGVTHQDLRLAEQILLRGRALICFYNKCDLLQGPRPKGFPHFDFVATCAGAAKKGEGMEPLMKLVTKVMKSYQKKVTTPTLNKIMEKIVTTSKAPNPQGLALKVRYITQVGTNPPSFKVFVNNLERLPENYKKYLQNSLYEELKLVGVPLRLDFQDKD
jgi:GTP-binding protein